MRYALPFGMYALVALDERFGNEVVGEVSAGCPCIEPPLSVVVDDGFSCLINSSTLRAIVPMRFTRLAFVYRLGLFTLMLANGVG